MIVWIASYPKSGNTLIRSMLAAYFFSNDGVYNFEQLQNIQQFPAAPIFLRMGIDLRNEREVVKNYIKAQESFNSKNSIQFIKTHSSLFNYNNSPFTNLNNTLGVIYAVRDPRNIVTSLANHSGISTEHAAETMINNKAFGGKFDDEDNSEKIIVYTGRWNDNYNSWKSFKPLGKYLLIKYEDMINNRDMTLRTILKFIYQINGKKFKIDQNKFKNVIESTTFKKMKKLEQNKGFQEAKMNFKTGKKRTFFNLGSNNDWKKLLDPSLKIKIENSFKKELKELHYL